MNRCKRFMIQKALYPCLDKALTNKPFPSREQVLALRKQYDAGTIIELIDM